MPNPSPQAGMPPALRTVLFWATVIGLAVFLWEMDSKSGNSGRPRLFLDLILAVAIIAIWSVISLLWRNNKRRHLKAGNSANRPLG